MPTEYSWLSCQGEKGMLRTPSIGHRTSQRINLDRIRWLEGAKVLCLAISNQSTAAFGRRAFSTERNALPVSPVTTLCLCAALGRCTTTTDPSIVCSQRQSAEEAVSARHDMIGSEAR